MRKIGLFLDSEPGGGTFQYNLSILEACKQLPSANYNLIIAYSSTYWLNHFRKQSTLTKKFDRTLFSRLWFQLRYPLAPWRKFCSTVDSFSNYFIKSNCDLWIFPSQDIWSYSLPVPALGTIHDLMHRYERQFPEVGSNSQYRARELHYHRMCQFAEGILVDSEIGKQQVIESYNVPANKIHILPYIPPDYINSIDESSDIFKIYNIPEKYIFYPAQFWNHKNHKALVRALAINRSKGHRIHLVFVGHKKNAYESIKTLISDSHLEDSITFLDYISDAHISLFYRKARAMIMPTFFGPTNIPPLEAFATGCPAAVSNIYAMSEQVGDAALLFDPNSDEEIAETLISLWTNDGLMTELVERGYKKSKEWNQNKFNTQLQSIINSILTIS